MRILVGLCVLVILGAATGRGQGEAHVSQALAEQPRIFVATDGDHSVEAPDLALSVSHLLSAPPRWLHRGRHLLTERTIERSRVRVGPTAGCFRAWACVVRPSCVRPFAHAPPSPAGRPHPPGTPGLFHPFPDPRPTEPCSRISASPSAATLDDGRETAGCPTSARLRPTHAVSPLPCVRVLCEKHEVEIHSGRSPPGSRSDTEAYLFTS